MPLATQCAMCRPGMITCKLEMGSERGVVVENITFNMNLLKFISRTVYLFLLIWLHNSCNLVPSAVADLPLILMVPAEFWVQCQLTDPFSYLQEWHSDCHLKEVILPTDH